MSSYVSGSITDRIYNIIKISFLKNENLTQIFKFFLIFKLKTKNSSITIVLLKIIKKSLIN